jgi:hypothetical protein
VRSGRWTAAAGALATIGLLFLLTRR